MSADADLAALASLCGIFETFRDLQGVMRPTSPETQRALLRASGLQVATRAEVRAALDALRAQQAARTLPEEIVVSCEAPLLVPVSAPTEWQLLLEGATRPHAEGRAVEAIEAPPVPMGVHALQIRQGRQASLVRLISAPTRTPGLQEITDQSKAWGVMTALYGLRSDRNGGLGDFEDLAQLGESLGAQGAGFLGLNPVHALGWAAEGVISPYSPTHRGVLNTNHLALDQLGPVPDGWSAAAGSDLIDYETHSARHRGALKSAYARFRQTASQAAQEAFAAFAAAGGEMLEDFARYECLSDALGPDWRRWPDALRTPALARQQTPPDDMGFHIWQQWRADQQLAQAQARSQAAGLSLGLYLDLAIGARRDGAEAWSGAETIARGVSLGAPPDHLSPAGQTWQLAAYAPRQLAAQGYGPLRQILRQVMRHCGVLRIDHALGLSRSYWIPDDGSPGGYIRQPFQSLMAIIAIEAHRSGTVIVGEDLGLVPEGFRDTMAARGFYGYTVLQYEKTERGRFRVDADLRPQSLACFGTHDTPTLAGFWAGRDIDWWHRLGWIDAPERQRAKRRRAAEKAELLQKSEQEAADRGAADLCDVVHRRLAEGPAALVAVQLDDILGLEEAQNLPGTVDAHPNWRRKCPVAVADLAGHEGVAKAACIMKSAGRSTS